MPASQRRAARIQDALRVALAPAEVEVVDDSARHLGHVGAQPGGETHYNVLAISPRFEALSRVARHRLVHDALVAEFGGGLHALSLTLRTPQEHAAEHAATGQGGQAK